MLTETQIFQINLSEMGQLNLLSLLPCMVLHADAQTSEPEGLGALGILCPFFNNRRINLEDCLGLISDLTVLFPASCFRGGWGWVGEIRL